MIVVLGNGKSRSALNLSLLETHTTYGCNAIYRDFSPTNLICGDALMMWEILKSGYNLKHQCYFKMFERIPSFHYDILMGMNTNEVFEYPKERTSEFVMYGQNNETAIYWVNPEEKTQQLDWWGDDEENSYNSGTAALRLACMQNPESEIYCAGFDYYLDRTADNIYLGSNNYYRDINTVIADWKSKENTEFDRKNWLAQHKRIEEEFPNVTFHFVGKDMNYYDFENLLLNNQ